jgi:hypothetical protein
MHILLAEFSGKDDTKAIFLPTFGSECFHEMNNDNGVRGVSFATSQSLQTNVLCSHIITFINLLAYLLIERQRNLLYIYKLV